MFFIISKILSFLISPFIISLILFIIGVLFKRYRQIVITASVIILLVFSNPLLFRFTIQKWEQAPAALPVNSSQCKYIVVLGGMSSHYQPANRVQFAQSADRLMQAMMLTRQNEVEKLIISGGSANILLKQRPEGAVLKEFLTQWSLPDSILAIDSLSRNTYENALYTAQMFDSLKMEKNITLVTSAWHMPRAKRCFEKQGFKVSPVGADAMWPFESLTIGDVIIPSAAVLQKWDLLIKEWVGMTVYKIKGYI